MTSKQRSSLIILSILVAAVAMGSWLRNFDVSMEQVSQLFARLRWWPIVPLLALLVGHVALSAWRWSIIEVGLGGERPKFGPAFATGAFALGLGTFLPAPMVNVACRGVANRLSGASGLRGALSGGIDQLADLAIVALLAIPGAIGLLYHDVSIYYWGGACILLLGFALIQLLPAILSVVKLPFRIPGLKPLARLADRRLLAALYGISLLRVANLTLMTLMIHAATGTATITAVVIAIPLVTLAISAAMLPGAFGVSEWSFSAVFGTLGIASTDIVLFVLANRIILTALSLLLALAALIAWVVHRRVQRKKCLAG